MNPSRPLPRTATAVFQVILAAALLASFAPADAKGRRSSSGSRSSSSSAHDNNNNSGGGTHLTIRTGSGSSSSSSSTGSQVAPGTSDSFEPIKPQAGRTPQRETDTRTPEQLAAIERAQAQKDAEQKAAADKAEADRLAAERLLAAQKAAADKAEAAERARVVAAQDAKRREQANIQAEADRVLQRAMSDYPVLRTQAGEPVLQRILARQKELMEKGTYPSIAMVEAVADYKHQLTPRPQTQAAAAPAPAPAPAAQPGTFGSCRWASPTQWVCN
jgi:hypothetical protein